ncbi:DUF2752 domain-containing protein [Sphaerisporangium sp. TRM90804]|uniref:DUF2752 domain-containing protein n=1 Tax=Sphaerisporangium sp. TRM90804 TaxID=3031113 RepID=UPI00244871C1|nr:DUF2752 domain-containing protein [Sphaerisporangium sp. TRM90804]MDH2428562.1 DUF2752 domain-containing protein [Sphaerisporangium sp. TRM90804]
MASAEPVGGRGARRGRALAAPLGTAVLAAAVVAYVGAVDPGEPGHYPPCPFLFVTGLYCPGCGTLRAIHALAHGDVPSALGLNVLTVGTVPFLLFWWGRWTLRAWQGRPARRTLAHPGWLYGLLALIVVFWVARNLPSGAFLAP